MRLDLIDRKILYNLDENARMSHSQLAAKLRISQSVLAYRIDRLKKSEIILGSFAEINNSLIGYVNFRIFIKLNHATHHQYLELLARFEKDPNVMWLSGVSGRWDIDVLYMTNSIPVFSDFYEELLAKYNSVISAHQVSLLSRVVCYSKDYLLDKMPAIRRRTEFFPDHKPQLKLDEYDLKLLRLLSQDAQQNIVDLALQSGLAVNTVKKRMTAFEKTGLITGYRLFYDTAKLGLLYYKLHVQLRGYTAADFKLLHEWLFSHPYVIYNNRYINAEHFEIELHVQEDKTLEKFKADLLNRFGKIVDDLYEIKFKDLKVYRAFPLQ